MSKFMTVLHNIGTGSVAAATFITGLAAGPVWGLIPTKVSVPMIAVAGAILTVSKAFVPATDQPHQ